MHENVSLWQGTRSEARRRAGGDDLGHGFAYISKTVLFLGVEVVDVARP